MKFGMLDGNLWTDLYGDESGWPVGPLGMMYYQEWRQVLTGVDTNNHTYQFNWSSLDNLLDAAYSRIMPPLPDGSRRRQKVIIQLPLVSGYFRNESTIKDLTPSILYYTSDPELRVAYSETVDGGRVGYVVSSNTVGNTCENVTITIPRYDDANWQKAYWYNQIFP